MSLSAAGLPRPLPTSQAQVSQPQGASAVPSNTAAAIALVGDAATMDPPGKILQNIEASKKTNWKSVSIRALSFLASTALGVLTGIAIAGTLVTPVGWAIVGAALLIALVGSIAYGGPKEFIRTLGISLVGFTLGLSVGAAAASVAIAGSSRIAFHVGLPLSMLYTSAGAPLIAMTIETIICGETTFFTQKK